MCFSATASFASATILSVAGIASLKKIRSPKQIMFASIPLLFAVQQTAEGFVWLSFSGIPDPSWREGLVKFFLVFALLIWPLWISTSMLLIENSKVRKIIHCICLAAGLLFACFACVYMFLYHSSARISNFHVYYDLDFPNKTNKIVAILYVSATVLPLIVSSINKMPLLGALIFVSYVITKYFYNDNIISVWCFFAAITSGIIYLMASDKIKVFTPKESVVSS